HAGLRAQVERALDELVGAVTGIAVLVGFPEWVGERRYNAAALIDGGAERARYRKRCLPNYLVFDEKRYFAASDDGPCVVELDGVRLALTICEDLWLPGPAADSAAAGAELVLGLSASPYQVGREAYREREVFGRRARETGLPVVCANLVGGQDELVFDGGSTAVAADGTPLLRIAAFEEGIDVVEFTRGPDGALVGTPGRVHREAGREASIW